VLDLRHVIARQVIPALRERIRVDGADLVDQILVSRPRDDDLRPEDVRLGRLSEVGRSGHRDQAFLLHLMTKREPPASLLLAALGIA